MEGIGKLENLKNVHFVGIGGISLSGLAEIMLSYGARVTGSDSARSETTDRLLALGIDVRIPNAAVNVPTDAELVVRTAAAKDDNPEVAIARAVGIPVAERAEFIGRMLKAYETVVSVAGTHGKTTTTGILADALAGLRPTVLVGGHMLSTGLNYMAGGRELFLLEACEYSNSFLHFRSNVSVILNMEYDHPDFFASFDEMAESFGNYARNIRPGGRLVVESSLPRLEEITARTEAHVSDFSIADPAAQYYGRNIRRESGATHFDILEHGEPAASVRLAMLGRHNAANALAAYAVLRALGLPSDEAAGGIEAAKGMRRRLERKGSLGDVEFFDDYAHHPTEIAACLDAVRAAGQPGRGGKLVCVFQPHTYSRTKSLLAEFSASFGRADMVVLLPIFPAREKFDPGISSRHLADGLAGRGVRSQLCETLDEARDCLLDCILPGDAVVTMGAGEAYKVGDSLIGHLSELEKKIKFSTSSTLGQKAARAQK